MFGLYPTRPFKSGFILILTLSLVIQTLAAPGAQARPTRAEPANAPRPLTSGATPNPLKPWPRANTELALARLDPALHAAALAGGPELTLVSVLLAPRSGTEAPGLAAIQARFARHLLRPGVNFDRLIGQVPANQLLKLAGEPGVLAILTLGERPAPEPPSSAEPTAPLALPIQLPEGFQPTPWDPNALEHAGWQAKGSEAPESFFTQDTNGVRQTWAAGVTGDGAGSAPDQDQIKLAIIDTGIDFANPDLLGTQARITASSSPYFEPGIGLGWPIAFDGRSQADYALDLRDERGNWGWYMNASLVITDPDLGATTPFTFTVTDPALGARTYTIGSALQSLPGNLGQYRFGWHPDDSLVTAWNTLGAPHETGADIGVLVLGTSLDNWGAFNAVSIDLYPDRSFDASDPLARLGNEVACLNLGASAPPICDISAGMVYYISNGATPIPASDWLYGMTEPAPGAVVAFMLNDRNENGGDHGTECAGTAAGQGVIDKVSNAGTYGSLFWPPTWYDPATEAISLGPAQDAGLVAMGNFYQGGSALDYYDFTALGYDGLPAGASGDHLDQPQLVSNSYGDGSIENDGWDLLSRYITLLNHGYLAQAGLTLPEGGARSPLFVISSGNTGMGYGTVNSPGASSAVIVGASVVFGHFNLGDLATSRDRVNWGDLAYISDRGPSALGTLAPHALASGVYSSGNLPLNMLSGGERAAASWSGTSRSVPETAGILALIYDAYYQKHGLYPTWRTARTLLMNGARTTDQDPLAQGAGLANAFNSYELITGTRGLEITSSEGDGYWLPGAYHGTVYDGFTRGLFAGESDTEVFTLTNWAANPVDVTLAPVTLIQSDVRTWNFTSLPLGSAAGQEGSNGYYVRRLYGPAGSPGGFQNAAPFYLSTSLTDTLLLQDADLMVVRLSWPYSQYNNNASQRWYAYAYAWRDDNLNNTWYNDANTNTVANGAEFNAGEYVRITYGLLGNNAEIRLRQPWARLNGQVGANEPPAAAMTDILLGIRHAVVTSAYPTTDIKVTVELYEEAPWPNLELSTPALTVPANSAAAFTATALTTVAAQPLPAGAYAGYIKLQSTLPYTSVQYLPVLENVWFDAAVPTTLGGVDQLTPYDNGVLFGGTGPSGSGARTEVGDWRFFYTDIATQPVSGTYLLAHTTWQPAGVPPQATDIDTLFFGPVPTDPVLGSFPELFGPAGLERVGGSLRLGVPPNWRYHTSSGGPSDWNALHLPNAGVYAIAAQTVLWGGEQTSVPFTITLGAVRVPEKIELGGPLCAGCSTSFTFQTDHPDLVGQTLEASGYGFTQPLQEWLTVTTGVATYYPYTLTVTDTLRLDFETALPQPGYDLDLVVQYWTGASWDTLSRAATGGSNELITLDHPAAGRYRAALYISTTSTPTLPEAALASLTIRQASGSDGLLVQGLPAQIVAGQVYTLGLSLPNPPPTGDWYGLVALGALDAPTVIQIPVWLHRGTAALTVNPANAAPGDLITYTLTLTPAANDSSTWSVIDLLPAGLDFVAVQGADYTAAPAQITWSGDPRLEPNGRHTITLTLQANGSLLGALVNQFELTSSGYTCPLSVTVTIPVALAKAAPPTAHLGERLPYTITLQTTVPMTVTAWLTDSLPSGAALASSPWASQGSAWYSATTAAVYWAFSGQPDSLITITYQVTITAGLSQSVVNLAQLDYNGLQLNAQAATLALPWQISLVYHDLEDVIYPGEALYLAGDFNGWNPTTTLMLHDAAYTVFTATLPVAPGAFAYQYVPLGSQPGWVNTAPRTVTVAADAVVHDYRQVDLALAQLMGPAELTLRIGLPTGPIIGLASLPGLTEASGPARGLMAQLGYGTGPDPAAWMWLPLDYLDETLAGERYVASFTPAATGVYSYAVRFDANWGAFNPHQVWHYGDLDGASAGAPFDLAETGILHVLLWEVVLPLVLHLK